MNLINLHTNLCSFSLHIPRGAYGPMVGLLFCKERTLATCGQEEVAAEARCASYVAARAEQRANLAEEEGQKAQEASKGSELMKRS